MNVELSRQVLEKLISAGVREFCVCAGARSAPLVVQLEQTAGVRLFPFFEERSAAFFALGRIRDSGAPMAVVTTSGTAVAETLPAVIEAYYQGLPLLILSADRPRHYRGTGAPQSIEQVGIFSHYVETCIDIERLDDQMDLTQWSLRRPLHVNVCFQEPRPTDVPDRLHVTEVKPLKKSGFFRVTSSPVLKNVVALIGPLQEDEKPDVEKFLESHEIPFVAEGPSSLRLSTKARERRLLSPDKSLKYGIEKGSFQSVLRLGGIPTLRFWRDLEEKYLGLPVTSCSNLDFTGLARPSRHVVGLENLMYFQPQGQAGSGLYGFDKGMFETLQGLVKKYPRAEPSLIRGFAQAAHQDRVYLGNSLPIREWDLVASDLHAREVWANRGANGIDGQTSSFLGWSSEGRVPAWALLGDLTAMYDLSAPSVTAQLAPGLRRLVIVNNFGGHIFRAMFRQPIFLNRHDRRFEHWAAMWGWDYVASDTSEVFTAKLGSHQVIELQPLESETDLFNQEWKSL